jgi:hypothetical protein
MHYLRVISPYTVSQAPLPPAPPHQTHTRSQQASAVKMTATYWQALIQHVLCAWGRVRTRSQQHHTTRPGRTCVLLYWQFARLTLTAQGWAHFAGQHAVTRQNCRTRPGTPRPTAYICVPVKFSAELHKLPVTICNSDCTCTCGPGPAHACLHALLPLQTDAQPTCCKACTLSTTSTMVCLPQGGDGMVHPQTLQALLLYI